MVDCEDAACEDFDDDLITLVFDLVDEFLTDPDWETEDFKPEGEEVLVA